MRFVNIVLIFSSFVAIAVSHPTEGSGEIKELFYKNFNLSGLAVGSACGPVTGAKCVDASVYACLLILQ